MMKHRYLLALLLASGCRSKEPADLILHNGKIVTVDDAFSIHEAIVVLDGKVVAVGGDDLLASYEAARVVDLQGKMAMPGFNDTHIHTRGQPRRSVDLTQSKSLADIFVLSDDLLTIDPEKILEVQVLMTIVGGKVVYESPLRLANAALGFSPQG